MIDFVKYFEPLSTDIYRGYRSVLILQTIDKLASENKAVLKYLNSHPLFWIETINAHRCNMLINLGKVFDIDSKSQSIHLLKRWINDNKDELQEESIRARQSSKISDNGWEEYKKHIHQFTNDDYAKYAKKISELQKKYESKSKDWRNKVFAHREHYDYMNCSLNLEPIHYDYLEEIYAGTLGLFNDAFNALYNGHCFSLKSSKLSEEKTIISQVTEVLNAHQQLLPKN